jgi:DNA-binding transcriptional regulator YiaG
MWDSGLRSTPLPIAKRAQGVMAARVKEQELLSLDDLARELGVYLRTLQAAARTGRLDAYFSVRSVFGRPIRFASRAAGQRFLTTHYRRFSGQQPCPLPLSTVPGDYGEQLRDLRQRLRLTQDALARRIGAARKAVVYQWEARKRIPSPVFWQRVLELKRVRRALRAKDRLGRNLIVRIARPLVNGVTRDAPDAEVSASAYEGGSPLGDTKRLTAA